MIIHTARLTLRPNDFSAMQALLDAETDAEMKAAYREMIDEMRRIPGHEEWACEWSVLIKGTETVIGGICFKGMPDERGCVEVGYGINEPYRGHGYATEATGGITAWALAQEDVRCVLAQTEENNINSQRVLLKNGFVRDGYGEEGPLFRKEGIS